jgi:hypothetical protein
MAFTDNCDLFASFSEEGINRVGRHIMRQRPSLFNYATEDVAGNRELWCETPEFTVDVTKFGNPIFTVVPYMPVIGADSPPVGLGFCVQVVRAQVDFHPSNTIQLPPELGGELQKQSFGLELKICGGLRCPNQDLLDRIPVTPRNRVPGTNVPPRPEQVHVPGEMICFCLQVFVVGHVRREFINGEEKLIGKVDGVEIVDVAPDGLEANLECYIRAAVTLLLRQKLAIAWQTLFVQFPLFGLGTISLAPTPNPPVPNNPAIEDDQLKAFVTMTVGP